MSFRIDATLVVAHHTRLRHPLLKERAIVPPFGIRSSHATFSREAGDNKIKLRRPFDFASLRYFGALLLMPRLEKQNSARGQGDELRSARGRVTD